MPNLATLEKESTSSGSATSASIASGHLIRYADELRSHAVRVPCSVEMMKLPVGASTFVYAGISKLLKQDVRTALSGTIASDNACRRWYLDPVVYSLFRRGFGDATQYGLRVETGYVPRTSMIVEKLPDARELTRRALELSDLTRDQLATAMGVRRQSVHNWLGARGGISKDNQEKLRDLVSLFERARRKLGSPRQVSNWLTTPVREDGPSPLELLAVSGIDAVRGRLLRGAPMRGASVMPTQAPQRTSRRMGPIGLRPPWTQPSRAREFDPEEEVGAALVDGVDEPYCDTQPSRVTGLARA